MEKKASEEWGERFCMLLDAAAPPPPIYYRYRLAAGTTDYPREKHQNETDEFSIANTKGVETKSFVQGHTVQN